MRITWSKALVVSLAVASMAAAQTVATPAEVQRWDGDYATFQFLSSIPLDQRGMVQASQDLTIVINGKAKDVFDIYANVNNALGLHPFLKKIVPIRNTKTTYDFLSYEDIPLPDGSIFNSITMAKQRFDRRNLVYYADTYTFPGIITRQTITFTQLPNCQVRAVEHLVFETSPTFIAQATQGGVFAHFLVQQGLKSKIEAGLLRPIRFPKYLRPAHGNSQNDTPRSNGCGSNDDGEEDDD